MFEVFRINSNSNSRNRKADMKISNDVSLGLRVVDVAGELACMVGFQCRCTVGDLAFA